jgi:RNA polymerase sigma factor (sigma-70 family)
MPTKEKDMASGQTSEMIQHLRRTVCLPDSPGRTDEQLLEDFINHRDEAAVAALIGRHGPMVWGVCCRLLRNHHDAEDAFQATFLVFVRRAASISSRELLANWLYGVAHQTARKARATIAKKIVRERQVTEMPEQAVEERDLRNDLQSLLDQELNRLPASYRVVLVLCNLEGKTRKDAAEQLGLPEGTVGSRLARGRIMLAKRLARHGLLVTDGSLLAVLSLSAASASVPASVASSTIQVATRAATGQATGMISINVAALTERVLCTMLIAKLKRGFLVLLAIGAIGFGGILSLCQLIATEEPKGTKDPTQKAAPQESKGTKDPTQKAAPQETPEAAKSKLQGTWVKASEEFGGKPVGKEGMRSQWWYINDDKLTIYSIDLRSSTPEKSEYSYSLGTDTNPKTLKFFGGMRVEGPRTKPPEDARMIYKIEGDTLTVAIGKKELPTEFKTQEGNGVIVVVFKREGKAEAKN